MLEQIMIPFLPKKGTKKQFQQLVSHRYAIYSDNDHILGKRSLEAFVKNINAK